LLITTERDGYFAAADDGPTATGTALRVFHLLLN
jgi:hypothetical protein